MLYAAAIDHIRSYSTRCPTVTQLVFDLSFWSWTYVHYTLVSEQQQTTAGRRNVQLANAAPPPYLFIFWQWWYLADLTFGRLQMVFVFIARRVCVPPPRLVKTTIHYIVFLGSSALENLSDGKNIYISLSIFSDALRYECSLS